MLVQEDCKLAELVHMQSREAWWLTGEALWFNREALWFNGEALWFNGEVVSQWEVWWLNLGGVVA